MPALDWIGKPDVVNHHKDIPFHLLKPNPALSVGEPDSGNLLIEGDNLLALKALLPYYAGKVKCIYIDPPYNTGNENWVYNDNVNSPVIKEWLGRVVGSEGEDLSRHDKWLCMMYPRLVLLRELLREDGVIFVSIDDNEVTHLRCLMDEIFGAKHFLAPFVWKKRTGSNDAKDYVSIDHEYVLTYRKTEQFVFNGISKEFKNYSNPDNDPRGPWARDNLTCNKTALERPNLYYEIVDPQTGITYPCNPNRVWVYERNRMERIIKEGKVIFPKEGKGTPQYKRHLSEVRSRTKPLSTWIEPTKSNKSKIEDQFGISILQTPINAQATKQLRQILGAQLFSYPKPIELIQELINQATDKNDLILDSFAGSGTTGHAVMQLNKEDGGRRRFILVELETEICRSITAERLRRVIEGYTWEDSRGNQQHEFGLGGGFTYYQLGETLLDATGHVREEIPFSDLANYIFFTETDQPLPKDTNGHSPFIGHANGVGFYLLYDGMSGNGNNVLTRPVLNHLPRYEGPKVIYGEGCALSPAWLKREQITFRQIPYDVRLV